MKIKAEIAYHCATEDLAKQFLKVAEEQGLLWITNEKPTRFCFYDRYNEETCYLLWKDRNKLIYSSKDFFSTFLTVPIVEYTGTETIEEV